MKALRSVILAALVAASGCVFVLGSPLGLLQRERPLEEKTVTGEGGDKILLIDQILSILAV